MQHNVNPQLDSNFYPSSSSNPALAIAQGMVSPAPSSPIGELWQPSKRNFAPRLGVAWDVFGDGKTSSALVIGIAYERNYGNVTFNVMFNPPNYAVIDLIAGSNVPNIALSASNYGPMSGTTGSAALPPAELRYIQPNIGQAYAHLISAAIEHQFASTHLEIEIIRLDRRESIRHPAMNIPARATTTWAYPARPEKTLSGGPDPCGAVLNPQYATINQRGSGGASRYNAMNVRYDIQNIHHSGLTLRLNYTWSHSLDDLSDTFDKSPNDFNYYESMEARLGRPTRLLSRGFTWFPACSTAQETGSRQFRTVYRVDGRRSSAQYPSRPGGLGRNGSGSNLHHRHQDRGT